jgi:nucleoside-diphosphate-sugar epimerase
MMRVLVTGATGFVGTVLSEELAQAGYVVRAALRSERAMPTVVAEKVVTGDLARPTGLAAALEGVQAVIHTAARTHVLRDSPAGAQLYMQVNAHATTRLAEAAAQAGVRRFVYLSSVKVNGEGSRRAYTADDAPDPQDAYGISKWLGEKGLREVAARTGMEASIVRSPLVYGPGVGANFLRLMRWVDAGWPLPLASIRNRRSLVSVWNLCSLLLRTLVHPAAPGNAWMVSDGQDLSTVELIRHLATIMGRPVRLLPLPVGALRAGAALMGKAAEIDRLCGSLLVDISQTRQGLGWTPPVPPSEGLARTAAWYALQRRGRGPLRQ